MRVDLISRFGEQKDAIEDRIIIIGLQIQSMFNIKNDHSIGFTEMYK
jgi:hypothetical protein